MYKFIKDRGMFLVTQRTEGISTTDVIGRIVRDYDLYLRRNIQRGLSRKELNISFMKEKQLKLQENFETIVRRGTHIIQNFDNKRKGLIDQLEDISHEVVRSFLRFFGADGRFRSWLGEKKAAVTIAISPSASPNGDSSHWWAADDDEDDYHDLDEQDSHSDDSNQTCPEGVSQSTRYHDPPNLRSNRLLVGRQFLPAAEVGRRKRSASPAPAASTNVAKRRSSLRFRNFDPS